MSGLSNHERIAYAAMLRTLPWSGLSEQVFGQVLRGFSAAGLEENNLIVEEQERRMALAESTASYQAYCDALETGSAS